jgi:hypothetical protein
MVTVKVCVVCGRTIEWRAKWSRDWEHVRYCSDGCRRRGRRAEDEQLEHAILKLLEERPRGATICPSEAARLVAGESWRDEMESARAAARRLHAVGRVVITQRGRTVDPATAKGPIRIRLG